MNALLSHLKKHKNWYGIGLVILVIVIVGYAQSPSLNTADIFRAQTRPSTATVTGQAYYGTTNRSTGASSSSTLEVDNAGEPREGMPAVELQDMPAGEEPVARSHTPQSATDLVITYPNGGEVFETGETVDIQWEYTGRQPASYFMAEVYLLFEDGKREELIGLSKQGASHLETVVTNDLTGDFKIRVDAKRSRYSPVAMSDVSDTPFSIFKPTPLTRDMVIELIADHFGAEVTSENEALFDSKKSLSAEWLKEVLSQLTTDQKKTGILELTTNYSGSQYDIVDSVTGDIVASYAPNKQTYYLPVGDYEVVYDTAEYIAPDNTKLSLSADAVTEIVGSYLPTSAVQLHTVSEEKAVEQ